MDYIFVAQLKNDTFPFRNHIFVIVTVLFGARGAKLFKDFGAHHNILIILPCFNLILEGMKFIFYFSLYGVQFFCHLWYYLESFLCNNKSP